MHRKEFVLRRLARGAGASMTVLATLPIADRTQAQDGDAGQPVPHCEPVSIAPVGLGPAGFFGGQVHTDGTRVIVAAEGSAFIFGNHPLGWVVEHEFSDVLAWVATLANLVDIDLSAVSERYRHGCPKCGNLPCSC